MKAQTDDSNNDKLRRNLKKLFKNKQTNVDDRTNGAVRKRSLGAEALPQKMTKVDKYVDNSTESIPKKKKRKVDQFESVPKAKAMSKPKKKSNTKSKSSHTDRHFGNAENKTNRLNDKCLKTSKCKPTSKEATSQNNKEQGNLSLVYRKEVDNSKGPQSDDYRNLITAYNEEYSSDEDNDYFDSYSDDYSYDSEEYSEESNSFDYEESDYSDYENGFQYESDCYTGSDPDYELPQNVPEDLVIHKGTAQKHDLDVEDEINFDSDTNEPQIFEMSLESKIEEIKQPGAYSKNELHKLNVKSEYTKKTAVDKEKSSDAEKDCPALVPIIDEDGFQLYNPESDYISYEEFSDNSSIFDEDINLKYIQSSQTCDTGCENKGRFQKQKQFFNVGIINVKNCTPLDREMGVIERAEETEIDNLISELFTANKMVPKIAENLIITASIRDNTNQITEKFEDNNAKSKQKLDSLPTVQSEIQNTNVVQHSETVNKEMDREDYDDFQSPSPDAAKNTSSLDNYTIKKQSQKVKPIPNATKAVKEKRNFRTMFINAVNSNAVLVLAKDPFYLYGTVCITLLAGKVDIYGFKPRHNEEFEIFSPRGCSSVQITCIPSSTKPESEKIADKLKALLSSFSSFDLHRIENTFECGQDAVLLLNRNVRRKKIKNIFKNYMNENVFPNMNSIQSDRPFYASEYQLDCVINTEAERSLRVPQEWQSLLFTTKSKVLLAGGKSVGKSTLLRYILNTQLEHCKDVLVIDLDIGQAELFVPQTISCTILNRPLLGPGFFLNHQPTRAYVVGHNNIVLCAQAYVRAVKKLIDFCYSKKEFAGMPWLINTMGYNKGFGMELMSIIVQLIRPTDIVQLQSNKEINNFDELLYPHVLASIPRIIYPQDLFKGENDESITLEYRLHVLCSAIMQESRYQRDWEMSAKDLRYATFLSRLSDALHGNAEWLTDCVPLSALIKELFFVNMVSNEATREDMAQAIEANLVYLCRKDEENDDPLLCFGIGIVRGIDLEKVYLLPAMCYDYLNEVNCLALGEMPLPSSLFTNQGPKVRNMAAFLYNTLDVRTSKSIKQIFHRPSRFLTIKHKDILKD